MYFHLEPTTILNFEFNVSMVTGCSISHSSLRFLFVLATHTCSLKDYAYAALKRHRSEVCAV